MAYLDERAFPAREEGGEFGADTITFHHGLTKREHAAISLRVPRSGNAELDAMILEARRWDLVTKIYAENRALTPPDCWQEADDILAHLSATSNEGGEG